MRQIIRVFVDQDFDVFPKTDFNNLLVVTFTQYLELPNLHIAYFPPNIPNGLAEYLSINGKNQLHIAETEKYAHVTYFFNCLNNRPFDGETDLFMESLDNPIAIPAMKAHHITEKVTEELDRDFYDFILINYANADILAHLGNLEAAIIGVQNIDTTIGRLKNAVLEKNGILIITSDHGNAERVIYGSGDPETRHDPNPVPFYMVAKEFKKEISDNERIMSRKEVSAILSDVAPTILELMEIEKPAEMTGESLLKLF